MTDIEPVLRRLGLQQYLDAFIAQGFDTWDTLLDIRESDLEYLNVKLGHRRRLQRAIAEWRGWGSDKPLRSLSIDGTEPEAQNLDGFFQESGASREQLASGPTEQKRKYRRHPKPDDKAPQKPPSAYVLFSNTIREEVKSENLSFTDIARLVGERWQRLDPAQKDYFESHASALKETYNLRLLEYKKTDDFKKYSRYLADFKAKHSQTSEQKRPKLELHQTSGMSIPSSAGSDGITQFTSQAYSIPIGSSSTVPYPDQGPAPASMSSQDATLPHLNTPIMRRHSPPFTASQDRRRTPALSSRSSFSEGSLSTKAEHSDTLSRTAGLSTTAASIEALPPLTIPGHGTGWLEYIQSPGYRATSARQPTQGYGPSTTSATSPVSTTTSIATSVGHGDWRERSQEGTRQRFGGGTASGSIAISQLVASIQGDEATNTTMPSRALPLPRQASASASQNSRMGLGVLTSPTHTHHQPPELTPTRERQAQERARRPENDGSDGLASIPERRSGAYRPWAPHSRTDNP